MLNPQAIDEFRILAQRVFKCANHVITRIDFLREISGIVIEHSKCDAVELWLREGNKIYRCEDIAGIAPSFKIETLCHLKTEDGEIATTGSNKPTLEILCNNILCGNTDSSLPCFTRNGSFWTGNVHVTPLLADARALLGRYKSLAIIPLAGDSDSIGLLKLKSLKCDFFSEEGIKFYELLTQTLGFALANHQAQTALHERVKELTCLYGISQICEQDGVSLEVILRGIVEHLPAAWQYPETASGRIVLDNFTHVNSGFKEGGQRLSADIVVNGRNRGVVEVIYNKEKPELDEGPFLKEERSLIDAVAAQIALIVQRKQAEEEKVKLSEQLRHADRLATIGQLAAGVAHEINEPLGSILGFAQLAKKSVGLPVQTEQDIDKIMKASLHAREIVKKLMLFARQTPPRKTKVNLNKLVDEGLYFLESRCAKEGIELVRVPANMPPEITADPSQLYQVLVNLAVNAVQAMQKGGRLTVQTLDFENHVSLVVEDTGAGMSEEVLKQAFIPFFTTKGVGQGTGLGLSVVHGIVTAHGGSISVESKIGHGSRFQVDLPKDWVLREVPL